MLCCSNNWKNSWQVAPTIKLSCCLSQLARFKHFTYITVFVNLLIFLKCYTFYFSFVFFFSFLTCLLKFGVQYLLSSRTILHSSRPLLSTQYPKLLNKLYGVQISLHQLLLTQFHHLYFKRILSVHFNSPWSFYNCMLHFILFRYEIYIVESFFPSDIIFKRRCVINNAFNFTLLYTVFLLN